MICHNLFIFHICSFSNPVGANATAAVFGVLASLLLFWTSLLATDSPLASFLAAARFGTARLVWQYSIQSEVFSLNNLLLLSLLYASVRIARTREASRCMIYAQAFLAGLCMTNQHTSVLSIAPTALWTFTTLLRREKVALMPTRRQIARWMRGYATPADAVAVPNAKDADAFVLTISSLGRVIGWALAGLTPYLYTIWAGNVGEYGGWGNCGSWTGFWTHLLRKEYGTFSLFSGGSPTLWRSGRLGAMVLRYWRAELCQDFAGVPLTTLLFAACIVLGRGGRGLSLRSRAGTTQRAAVQPSSAPRDDSDGSVVAKPKGGGHKDSLRQRRKGSAPQPQPAAPLVALENGTGLESRRAPASSDGPFCRDLVLSTFVLYIVGFQGITNLRIEEPLHLGAHERFFIQAHVSAFFLLAIGLAETLKLVAQKGPAIAGVVGSVFARSKPIVEGAAAMASIGIATAAMLSVRPDLDESSNVVHLQLARTLIGLLPHNATVLTRGDMFTNNLRYLQLCEGRRHDVLFLDQPMMTYPWFVEKQARHFQPAVVFPGPVYHPRKGYSIGQFLQANLIDPSQPRPLFLLGGWYDPANDASFTPLVFTEPLGVFIRVHDAHKYHAQPAEARYERWRHESRIWMEATCAFPLPPPWSPTMDPRRWEHKVGEDRYTSRVAAATHALVALMSDPSVQTVERLRDVAQDLQRCIADPYRRPGDYAVFKNLGIVSQRLVMLGDAEAYSEVMVAAFARYLELAPPGDAQRGDIETLVRMHTTKRIRSKFR